MAVSQTGVAIEAEVPVLPPISIRKPSRLAHLLGTRVDSLKPEHQMDVQGRDWETLAPFKWLTPTSRGTSRLRSAFMVCEAKRMLFSVYCVVSWKWSVGR